VAATTLVSRICRLWMLCRGCRRTCERYERGAALSRDAGCRYDMKKQLSSMALTLRNVAVLDTKASARGVALG
jgi:hypothetical protein